MKKTNKSSRKYLSYREQSSRIISLDILRGIAVVLMVQQHTGFWFWNNKGSIVASMGEYPLMVIINGLGALAAPLFILLSGTGAALLSASGAEPKIFFKRGIIIIFFGYLLNLLTPSWFSPGSWYVLHLIGTGIILTPLISKISQRWLFFSAVLIIAAAPLFLTCLSMPRYFGNEQMASCAGFGDVMLHAFVSGNFPVFPWLALFISGFASGRLIKSGSYGKIIKASLFTAASALILVLIKYSGLPFVNSPLGERIFFINFTMYPSYPIQFLFLSFLALVSLYACLRFTRGVDLSDKNILALTGRVSLTIFMLHIIIIRNVIVHSRYWKSFSAMESSALQVAVLLFIFAAVILWEKIEFKFGFEWLLRRWGR